MTLFRFPFALIAFIALLAASASAQQASRKSHPFQGTVRSVNKSAKSLNVENDPIPGGMDAMTMSYSVENEQALTGMKAGDRITATIYDGDSTLYGLQVVPQATSGLSLDDFERLALAGNPTVAQAQANLQVATGMVRQAGLYPNPTVGYYGDEIRGGFYGGGKQGFFVSQTIVTGGKLRAARRVADLAAQETKTVGELQRARILNNARILFYQVLAAQRLVEVRQNLSKLAGDAAQTSRQLANVGQADRPDVLQSEVEQQQAAVSVRVAEQNLLASWRMLAAVAGKPELPLSHLVGDLEAIPELDYNEWLAATLRDSPEVKLATQKVEKAEASLTQAKKAPIPDIQLYGNLSQNFEPLETTGRPAGLNGGVQIGVQLPIFNRNQGGSDAAKGEIESARQEVVRVKLQISRELAGLFQDYDAMRITARQYKTEMLPRAEQAYQMYRTNYANMAAAYPQALISQRTLFQLEVDYVQALESVWRSALGIRAFGLVDGLAMPGATSPGAP